MAADAGTRSPRDPRASREPAKSDPDLGLPRAGVANITAYMFFNRGECGACALRGDIVVDEDFITLL